jgi:hypothetical protein
MRIALLGVLCNGCSFALRSVRCANRWPENEQSGLAHGLSFIKILGSVFSGSYCVHRFIRYTHWACTINFV